MRPLATSPAFVPSIVFAADTGLPKDLKTLFLVAWLPCAVFHLDAYEKTPVRPAARAASVQAIDRV